ncbi:uncharacterized protein LOC131928387 [Physella acuta]|uniref:uncharacterized protein LOC131928387 n=1 Tax=Physella acuta TaxID=109671 RepID=UPI0027DC282C|nr:uncharacterized protein LOC131928387 [Physella acuta]
MRLKAETIRKRSKVPLHVAKFLDLSGLELVKLDHLEQCENLHWLKARNNKLESDEGLENLKQLWSLDLSNNQICILNSLSRYLALGTVILSNNNLKWIDLEKIRHAHFLSISLHGNPCLDSDPYYRIHAIDCLPLIWELDGRLVTVTERLHVKQFFIDSELTEHPVRHKMGRTFRTTAVKNIGILGVVSKQCKYIYSKFPLSETHTKHTDERRLRYLTRMVQEDILRWVSHGENKSVDSRSSLQSMFPNHFLEKLMEARKADVERCNMLLLLLVISLDFQLPTSLLKSVLSAVDLDPFGSVSILPYFLLPPSHRTRVICILLNAAKVDRDNNAHLIGGLYPQLFMCIYFAVSQLTKISQTSEANMHKIKSISLHADCKALMAGEIVSLMLQVPRFLTYLQTDEGVYNLVVCAAGSEDLVDEWQEELIKAENIFNKVPMRKVHSTVTENILAAVHTRLDKIDVKMSDIPVGDRYLALSDSLPLKPTHSVIWASQFLTKGQPIPKLEPPILNPAREAAKEKPQQPKLGDKVLLSPQVVGEISMLLAGEIALVKIDGVPVSTGGIVNKFKNSEAHYSYVDMRAMCFSRDIGMWKPIKTDGNKFTLHSAVSKGKNGANENLLMLLPTEAKLSHTGGSFLTKRAMSAGPLNKRALSSESLNKNKHNVNRSMSQTYEDVHPGAPLFETDHSVFITDLSRYKFDHYAHDGAVVVPNPSQYLGLEGKASQRSLSAVPFPDSVDQTGRSDGSARQENLDQHGSDLHVPNLMSEVTPGAKSVIQLPHHTVPQATEGLEQLTPTSEPGMEQLTPVSEQGMEQLTPVSEQGMEQLTPVSEQQMDISSPSQQIIDKPDPVSQHKTDQLTRKSEQNMDTVNSLSEEKVDKMTLTSEQAAKNVSGVTPKKGRFTNGFLTSDAAEKKSITFQDIKLKEAGLVEPSSVIRTRTALKSASERQLFHEQQFEKFRRQRPYTAIGHQRAIGCGQQTAGNQTLGSAMKAPPPQRPSSPTASEEPKRRPVKIAHAGQWLGGGRDLFWEEVRKRPKSGHVPGWKEGLPKSMTKPRPKSALVAYVRPDQHGPSYPLDGSMYSEDFQTLEDQYKLAYWSVQPLHTCSQVFSSRPDADTDRMSGLSVHGFPLLTADEDTNGVGEFYTADKLKGSKLFSKRSASPRGISSKELTIRHTNERRVGYTSDYDRNFQTAGNDSQPGQAVVPYSVAPDPADAQIVADRSTPDKDHGPYNNVPQNFVPEAPGNKVESVQMRQEGNEIIHVSIESRSLTKFV